MVPHSGDGGCTPHFLFETSKRKCAVHGGKEKMSGPKSFPAVRFGQNGGRTSRFRPNLQVSCRVRLGLREQRSASPQLGAWVRLSGRLSDLAHFLPRAFRFATHYPGGSLHENFPQQNRSGSGTRSRGHAPTTPESKSESPTCGGRSPLFHRCPAHPAEGPKSGQHRLSRPPFISK